MRKKIGFVLLLSMFIFGCLGSKSPSATPTAQGGNYASGDQAAGDSDTAMGQAMDSISSADSSTGEDEQLMLEDQDYRA